MDEKKLWEIVEKKLEERVGSALKIASYMEYQVDLMTQIIKDLTTVVDTTNLPAEAKDRLQKLEQFLGVSSIDFVNLASPYESFKLPGALQVKKAISDIRKPYLDVVFNSEQV